MYVLMVVTVFAFQLHDQEMQAFTNKVAAILKDKCPELAKAISDVYVPSKG